MWKDIEMGLYSPEQFESVYKKIWTDNVELTRFDMFVLDNPTSVRFNYFESTHFQKQLGMINGGRNSDVPITHTAAKPYSLEQGEIIRSDS